MKNVIIAALENEGLIICHNDIKAVKFVRKTCNDNVLGAIYHAIVYDDNEDIFNVVSIFMNCEDLTADFGGSAHFEGSYDECVEYFNE
ncbi:hypothetical protein ACQ46_gp166 [Citrobacter phage Moon]|uniref:Uncharacterized protein n=2 Tax=Moonvirus TaxID=1985329 RepID=A0A0K1LNF6_9CAUD|nr:hypothetical protein ACQ46_gp166 [Citrobacter phage Moon]YP_009204007.1 hypothetical protein CPT_Merlin293 [Citrobacter phage Merlin]AIX12258.1 hypothetical protein CPT_Moon287 [Citrobacter phage Moon]AKU43939.1 hypothetical protein CPT_Merlin293 [Citrobacter phage Merlin]